MEVALLLLSQELVRAIGRFIAAREPETGGALLRLRSSNILVDFLEDPEGATSGATYTPSLGLTDAVRARERGAELQYAGIVHSHPGNMAVPSRQDHRAFALGLAVNPHLAMFVAPIITVLPPHGRLGENELPLSPRGKLTLYVAYRAVRRGPETPARPQAKQGYSLNAVPGSETATDPRDDPITLVETPVGVHPADDDFAGFVSVLSEAGLRTETRPDDFRALNGAPFIVKTVIAGDAEIVLMFPVGYPFVPPFCLLTMDDQTQEVSLPWSVAQHGARLHAMAGEILVRRRAPQSRAPRRDPAVETAPHRAPPDAPSVSFTTGPTQEELAAEGTAR